ncbi:hypothetical protein LTR28_005117 [Elasticomyces elasticus]|nr:hypothetical protein LTR28_005117 [Elasticomyces elasticus]
MLVELKNGETLNGHLTNCDTWMNLTLVEVIQTTPDGQKFFRLPEVYVRGNNQWDSALISVLGATEDEAVEGEEEEVAVEAGEEKGSTPFLNVSIGLLSRYPWIPPSAMHAQSALRQTRAADLTHAYTKYSTQTVTVAD